LTSWHSDAQPLASAARVSMTLSVHVTRIGVTVHLASECPDVKKTNDGLNSVWHRYFIAVRIRQQWA